MNWELLIGCVRESQRGAEHGLRDGAAALGHHRPVLISLFFYRN